MPINSSDIVSIISQRLGMSFLLHSDQEMLTRGNVCFAQSPELRPEYRESFTLGDLIGYLYGIVHSLSKKEIYPTNSKMFWETVKIGNELPQNLKVKNVSDRISIDIRPYLNHNRITQVKLDGSGRIWINELQLLDGIPPQAEKLKLNGNVVAKQWLENYSGKELGPKEMQLFRGLIEDLNEVCQLLNLLKT